MTIPTFNPPMTPSIGATNKPEVKILRADFGDGYTQAARDGMNNVRDVYDLSWDVLTQDDANAIGGFLAARGGCDPFLYSLPGSPMHGKWTCEVWTDKAITAGYRAMTATFRQCFNVGS